MSLTVHAMWFSPVAFFSSDVLLRIYIVGTSAVTEKEVSASGWSVLYRMINPVLEISNMLDALLLELIRGFNEITLAQFDSSIRAGSLAGVRQRAVLVGASASLDQLPALNQVMALNRV